jgi:HEAT repeat protein/beta-lactamase regulating signal transducer with metallopeptidase domain
MSDTGMQVAAWLLTYALHSTVLLGAAALLTARWVRGEAWRETLWKAALLGGIVTATVQTSGWIVGDLGRWQLAALPPAEPAESPAPAATPAEAPSIATQAAARDADPPPVASSIDPTPRTLPLSEEAGLDAAPAAESAPSRPVRTPLAWAMLAWALGAAGMLVRLALRQARLRSLLEERTPVEDDAVFSMLAGLRRNAGIWRPVHLTTCAATPTPLALGGGEICVPPRFLSDLDPEQQRTALAHELAHIARRDPAWHFAAGVVESVFFFQPLNRLARVRLRESAEFLCDAWAARQTGSPLGLARCLAEVASWVAPGRHPIPAGTMAMAEGGSPLVQRVQRLMAWRGEPREGSGVLRLAGAALLIAAVAAIAPAVASPDSAREDESASAATTPSVANGDGQEIVIIRHPDPAAPLERRWTWAVDEIARRGLDRAWIAYSVPVRLGPGGSWMTDSGPIGIGSVGNAPLNQALRAPAEHAVLLFTVARGGELKRVAGRRAAGMELGGLPVVWLGTAEGAESFARLRGLADGLGSADAREGLVEMIGIHPGDAVVPYLAAVLGRDGSNGVRREAAQALGLHPTDEALAALRTAVERDGSNDVRREAVEALGAMGTAPALAALHGIALRGRDAGVRKQAVESLGETRAPGAMETLSTVAFGDRDKAVARQAVEAMEHLAPAQSTPVLVQIAFTHPDPHVAKQAAESLGALPAPWAVEPLDSIARTHSDPYVAQQAVESLGGFPDVISSGYIQQIARAHPSPRVREEARDQLRRGDSDRGTGGDPDPDWNVELDPGSDPDPDYDPGPGVGDAATTLRETARTIANAAASAGATP